MEKEEKRVVLAAHEEAEQPAVEENTDWRNAGSIRDYLDAIGEQIENPHARCAIRREIGNHIEEQPCGNFLARMSMHSMWNPSGMP